MRYFLIVLLFLGNIFAFEIKKNNEIISVDFNLIDNGFITNDKKSFSKSSDLLIKFNEENYELINDFETKYNLRLKRVLIIGYYLYESNGDTLDLISKIINEENVKTIKPNWKKVKGIR